MEECSFTDVDGVEVFYREWRPRGDVHVVVVAVHGASEHSGRYARLAEALVARGDAVYAPDLRGHGRTAASTGPGRIGPRGMTGVLDDVGTLVELAHSRFPGVPVLLFGHSMGSLVVQAFVEERRDHVAGYVLSGTMGAMDGVAEIAGGIRAAVDAGMADDPLDMLGGFNEAFEPARTPYDWLTRDPEEVDRYVTDPLCGDDLPLTYGFVAAMFATLGEVMEPSGIARVPWGLPVLLLTGTADPVSNGGAQVRVLEQRLREAGLDVTAKYYDGARHEVLNETNRDEVLGDLVGWIGRVTATV